MPTLKKKGAKKATNTRNAARANRAKRACIFGPFKLAKKDAFKMSDLRKDKTKVSLNETVIARMLADYGHKEDNETYEALKEKLCARTFDIKFSGDFYEPPENNMLWELSCQYNDIVKIKEFLLQQQIQSLLASVGKGYIEIDDI
jgi:hypothetical protein